MNIPPHSILKALDCSDKKVLQYILPTERTEERLLNHSWKGISTGASNTWVATISQILKFFLTSIVYGNEIYGENVV